MKATMGSTMTNYEGALLADRSDLGVLQITGATRLDLLNRMSTQDLRSLQAGMGAATVLTTDIGRIIDRLLLSVDTDSVTVITGENNGDNIARYLLRFVFFNDDFQLVDRSNLFIKNDERRAIGSLGFCMNKDGVWACR